MLRTQTPERITHHIVTLTIKGLTSLLCAVDDHQLINVPSTGPLILAANHVNFLDVPIVYTRLQPRPVTGLVKVETWDNPLMGALFNLWGGIPLRRGEVDRTALRKALAALKEGQIVAIAPEGTRSGDGRLQRGHAGIVLLALYSRAPILPVAYYGGERFRVNIKRLQRTEIHIAVGKPFCLRQPVEGRVTRRIRQQMLDEIMYQIALLLPPAYRGVYSNVQAATQNHLCFCIKQ